ncbi:glycosyltransferase group 1 protein [Sediminihabitans luteus]|nr:glycosyltransferase group 1 protein [Sediminihabitans luteus]
MRDHPARVVVVLAHEQDPERWRVRHDAGEVADATPYGYDTAASWFDLRWAASHPEGPVVRRIRSRIALLLGFDLLHVWRNRRLVRESDVVWTHTEREHLAVAALLVLRRRDRRPRVLAQSVWLWDRWPTFGAVRRAVLARLLRRQDVEVVHSTLNRADSEQAVPGRLVVSVPFGTTPPRAAHAEQGAEVVAVGNDTHRDWQTLAEAAGRLPAHRFRVVTTASRARQIAWPANVTVQGARSRDEIERIYAAATVAVVPLRENRHASGSTACVEARAAGLSLVVSRTGGIEPYAGPEARIVVPGDGAALADAIRDALAAERDADRAVRGDGGVVAQGLTQADYVRRYVLVTQFLLGDRPWPDDATALHEVVVDVPED